MSTLAEIQSYLRDAVIDGNVPRISPWLTCSGNSEKRLSIHQRNYETSLVNALLQKFPATAWLVGTAFLTDAATRFVHKHPPQAPCIAEYGEGFPRFLSESPAADRLPYLGAFTRLEWHVGQVAIAVDQPAIDLEEFPGIDMDSLPDAQLTLQSGVRYLQASSPVDDLMKLYLTETAPDRFKLIPADVWIEVRGARGEFQINRLDPAEFIFRKSILSRRSVGDAAERALDTDNAFDPGQALARLIAVGFVTAVHQPNREE